MKAANIFVKALENEGVEYIFAVPGEENLDVIEAVRTSKIKLMVLRHEQTAGFMAATYGRVTGKPGVCLVTLGPGATNLMTAVAHAQLGTMPMVVITGQKPIKSHTQGEFQMIDVVEIMRPITKHAATVVHSHTIPAMVRHAFHLACEEVQGVVHIEVPEDVAQEDCKRYRLFPAMKPSIFCANEQSISKALAMIRVARHPLVMIGARANREEIQGSLTRFVKKTGLPFFCTQMGKGTIDESLEEYLGTAALSEGDFLHAAIKHTDLILNVGHDTVEKPPFFMSEEGSKVIHINTHPARVNSRYFPQLEVIGDVSDTIDRLTEKVEFSPRLDLSYYKRVKEAIGSHRQEHIEKHNGFPISPPYLVDAVQEVMPKDGCLTLDNGMYKIWFARNYKAHRPHSFLLDDALATMGAGVSMGMMVKLLYPKRKVMSVCGDGGFVMNSNVLASAIDFELDIVIVVLRDNGYGMIKWKQETMGFDNFGLEFSNPDFVQYAQAHGAYGDRIMSAQELVPKLRKALRAGGVHVIEVPIDYSKNTYMLGEELAKYTRGL